ncbi:MAG: hypothetical protein IKP00_01545 [Victivallales bacterium]|nr:hypothetical protein [Victivallales bacterium]
MLNLSFDKKLLEKRFQDVGIPESGLSAEELEARLPQYMKKQSALSPMMQKAEGFAFLLDNMRVAVSSDDLFVDLGIWGRKPLESALAYPRKVAVEKEYCRENIPIKNRYSTLAEGYFNMDYAHSVPDYDAILGLGFPGLLRRTEEAERNFASRHGGTMSDEVADFFQSICREYGAILSLLDRFILWGERKGCQPETLDALRHLRIGRPETFYEAMLQIWLYYQCSEYADCIQTRSFGNLDVMLFDYYKNDIATGRCEEGDARGILRNFMLKVSSMKYYWGHPFFLGGSAPDGSSLVNELSRIILDEYGKLNIYDPKIQIKVSPNTPVWFIDQALTLIRSGRNSMVFVGEPCIQKTMMHYGYSPEEARTADIKGCYEYSARGCDVETTGAVLNIAGMLMRFVREHANAATFEELLEAVMEGFRQMCDEVIEVVNRFEPYLGYVNPAPMFSGASLTALEKGIDGYSKGSKYNNSNIWLAGPITAVNSLAMIKKYVFEKHAITLPHLLEALRENWKGQERLRQMILRDPDQFGNNRELPDSLAVTLLEGIADSINGRANSRGGIFTTALHSANGFINYGSKMGATPDGRLQGEELSKNVSIRPGSNHNGVTAVVESVLKLNPAKFMADFPLDIMLHPSAVAGEDGLEAMRTFVMAYVRGGGHAIHFNVFSLETLEKARKNPENYRDLQVRVCGWNVLWNNLSDQEQLSYMKQARANEETV